MLFSIAVMLRPTLMIAIAVVVLVPAFMQAIIALVFFIFFSVLMVIIPPATLIIIPSIIPIIGIIINGIFGFMPVLHGMNSVL
jgi:hypothetical protein